MVALSHAAGFAYPTVEWDDASIVNTLIDVVREANRSE